MNILARFQIQGTTVSIIEEPGSIEIEVSGAKNPAQKTAIEGYLFEEGIMDEIFLGNNKFHEKTIEEILAQP